jgi:hypothetical protein
MGGLAASKQNRYRGPEMKNAETKAGKIQWQDKSSGLASGVIFGTLSP